MSIATEITRLNTVKAEIASAITEKGVAVPLGTALSGMPDLIRQISSGGSSGLSITAYASVDALPSTADEYALAVITGTAITSYVVDWAEPSSPAEGMVWMQENRYSNTPIPLGDGDNPIYVHPNACRQYVNGAWANKLMYVFMGGAWAETRHYLFDISTDDTDVTLSRFAKLGNYTSHSVTDGYYRIANSAGGSTQYEYYSEPFDITGYNYIVTYGRYAVTSGEVMLASTSGATVSGTTVSLGNSLAEYRIPLSAVAGGEYCWKIGTGHNGSTNIYRVWLE